MYVCLCRVVPRRLVEAAIASGARTVAEVGERCQAGTDCGRCQRTIARLLEGAAQALPPQAREQEQVTPRW